jgi:HEAT repeat protein
VAIPALLALLGESIDVDPGGPGKPRPANDWNAVQGDPGRFAAELLGQLGPGTKSAGAVIAALTEVVRSGHPSRRDPAVFALGAFGPAAEPAVPVIIHALQEVLAGNDRGPFFDGSSAARALGRIAPGTKSADDSVAVLIEALNSPSETHLGASRAAIEALPAFGARAASTMPRLRALQNDQIVGRAASDALKAIEGARSEQPTRNESR